MIKARAKSLNNMADKQQLVNSTESQNEDQSASLNEPSASGGQDVQADPKEIMSEQEPALSRRNKVHTTVPTEGVELAIGQGELEGAEPVTFGQLFQRRVQEFPTVAALKWKEKVGEGEAESEVVWKTATFAEYYKSCVVAAKSLLKAR
jgi:hypothetical protein